MGTNVCDSPYKLTGNNDNSFDDRDNYVSIIPYNNQIQHTQDKKQISSKTTLIKKETPYKSQEAFKQKEIYKQNGNLVKTTYQVSQTVLLNQDKCIYKQTIKSSNLIME